jgi:hypothetical protein
MAEGSDKKLDNLKKAIANSKAKKKSSGSSLPKGGDPSYEIGTRRSSGSAVDLNNPADNVARFGREFTAPKGRKGTSYSMGRKRGK